MAQRGVLRPDVRDTVQWELQIVPELISNSLGTPAFLGKQFLLDSDPRRAVQREHHIDAARRHPARRWEGALRCDVELRFRRPDGRPLPDVPLPPVIPDDPVQALRERNEAAGLNLHAQTLRPGWPGERLDVGWAIDVLHPRALKPLVMA